MANQFQDTEFSGFGAVAPQQVMDADPFGLYKLGPVRASPPYDPALARAMWQDAELSIPKQAQLPLHKPARPAGFRPARKGRAPAMPPLGPVYGPGAQAHPAKQAQDRYNALQEWQQQQMTDWMQRDAAEGRQTAWGVPIETSGRGRGQRRRRYR